MKQRFRGLASRILYLALGCVSSFAKKFRKSENFDTFNEGIKVCAPGILC